MMKVFHFRYDFSFLPSKLLKFSANFKSSRVSWKLEIIVRFSTLEGLLPLDNLNYNFIITTITKSKCHLQILYVYILANFIQQLKWNKGDGILAMTAKILLVKSIVTQFRKNLSIPWSSNCHKPWELFFEYSRPTSWCFLTNWAKTSTLSLLVFKYQSKIVPYVLELFTDHVFSRHTFFTSDVVETVTSETKTWLKHRG